MGEITIISHKRNRYSQFNSESCSSNSYRVLWGFKCSVLVERTLNKCREISQILPIDYLSRNQNPQPLGVFEYALSQHQHQHKHTHTQAFTFCLTLGKVWGVDVVTFLFLGVVLLCVPAIRRKRDKNTNVSALKWRLNDLTIKTYISTVLHWHFNCVQPVSEPGTRWSKPNVLCMFFRISHC